MLLLVLLDHTKTWIFILTCFVFSYFRDFHVLYVTLGATATTLIAKLLKVIIRQPRPFPPKKIPTSPPPSPRSALPQNPFNLPYGMPSTHSASIMYFAAYISLHLFTKQLDFASSIALFVVLTTALSVVWSRVELGHHTKAQVFAGMALGLLCGYAWHVWWRERWWPTLVRLNVDGKIGRREINVLMDILGSRALGFFYLFAERAELFGNGILASFYSLMERTGLLGDGTFASFYLFMERAEPLVNSTLAAFYLFMERAELLLNSTLASFYLFMERQDKLINLNNINLLI